MGKTPWENPVPEHRLETYKSYARRAREGWYDKYIHDPGIDIGCSNDPIDPDFRRWDFKNGDGDATLMQGVPDASYMTVYTSHILEHLNDPVLALKNWYRILRPGGHLIVCVPHRDLYEKKRHLPSLWNGEHKTFWWPQGQEPPCTFGLKDVIAFAIPEGELVLLRVLDEGWEPVPVEVHSHGEYAIEAVVRKPSAA